MQWPRVDWWLNCVGAMALRALALTNSPRNADHECAVPRLRSTKSRSQLSVTARKMGPEPTVDVLPLPPGAQYHFFISHSQATGGDQANLLATNLEKKGLKIWVRAAALLSVL